MLEVEKRGFLAEDEYHKLLIDLEKIGKSLGQDDKDVVYYVFENSNLKLVNNISKGNSKVAFKDGLLNKTNVFPEYEVEIKQEDFEKMKLIFSKILSPKKIFEGVQKRYNFEIDGCEIAVKWSESWGYHFEIEKMISEDENPEDVYEEFDKITKKLGIRTSTDEEIKKFLEKYQ